MWRKRENGGEDAGARGKLRSDLLGVFFQAIQEGAALKVSFAVRNRSTTYSFPCG